MTYKYYDTPDGEDCFKKIWCTTKLSLKAGLPFAAFEMLYFSSPQTYLAGIVRFGHWMIPFASMGAVAGATTCISTQLRQKDDYYNHFIAGLAAGSVWGIKYKRSLLGLQLGIAFGLGALINKYMDMNGFKVYKEPFDSRHHSLMLRDIKFPEIFPEVGRPIDD